MSSSEWKTVKLIEIVDTQIDNRGRNPDKYLDYSDHPVIDNYLIKNQKYPDMSEVKRYIDKENFESFLRGYLKKDDVLITLVGNGIGNVTMAPSTKSVIVQNTIGLRTNENASNTFLYYLLLFYQDEIKNFNRGTSQPSIKKTDLFNLAIQIPPLQEQKSIAHILSTLDDKIEVNNQINKTLENMAQAIFKQWFVDFEFPNEDGEPYKSSGGEMVESELGMIPEGWEVGSFSDYISSMLGGDWGKDSPQGNFTQKVYCLRGADINDIVAGNKGKMPERYIIEKNLLKKKLNSGNLVVEISGGSPTQSTGRIAYVSNDLLKRYNSPLVATNFCRAIKLKNDEHMEFFYNYWKIFYQNNIFFHYENGTTGIKNLDISSFIERHPIIIPNENIVSMFTRQAKLFYKMHQNYGVENSLIETLRDSLLPKLMSGEIRVHLEEEGDAS